MREPPVDLPSATLCAGLRTNYGLAVTDLTFLPLGHDSAAWVYRVRTADDTLYFLKIRKHVTMGTRRKPCAYGAILRQIHATALAPDLAQLGPIPSRQYRGSRVRVRRPGGMITHCTGLDRPAILLLPSSWMVTGVWLRPRRQRKSRSTWVWWI